MMKFIVSLICFLSLNVLAKNLPAKEKKYLRQHLHELHQNGGLKTEDKMWERFKKMAIKYDNAEVLNKMFQVGRTADGEGATTYQNDLFEIYQKNTLFFIKTASDFYKGELAIPASIFVNETEDTSMEEALKPLKKISQTKEAIEFEKALRFENGLTPQKRKSRSD